MANTLHIPPKEPQSKSPVPEQLPATVPDAPIGAASPEQRHQMIELAAYFAAERRGFCNGSALEDWLAAEMEVDRQLGNQPTAER